MIEAMDLAHFLQEKLHVAKYLYESAAPLFEEIQRKVAEHEHPYVFTGDPERYCGDEFYSEWSDALVFEGLGCGNRREGSVGGEGSRQRLVRQVLLHS
jgi:hypothetical protein